MAGIEMRAERGAQGAMADAKEFSAGPNSDRRPSGCKPGPCVQPPPGPCRDCQQCGKCNAGR